jgi:hypothetical protein
MCLVRAFIPSPTTLLTFLTFFMGGRTPLPTPRILLG